MNNTIVASVAFALAAGLITAASAAEAPIVGDQETDAKVGVCFAPQEDCATRIVDAINGARTSVHTMQLFLLQKGIIKALIKAHERGVDVQVIADHKTDAKEEAKACAAGKHPFLGAKALLDAGVPILVDDSVKTAHNKISVIDGNLVIGGSFNYTDEADKQNAENATFITSPVVAKWYEQDFAYRKTLATPYTPQACDNG
jgi:phosphatidylserine/phosphatidylglycerophosphate/cardiolipin synthase-like enzyme